MFADVVTNMLKVYTYTIVVGFWMGYFLYSVIMDSFERDVAKVAKSMGASHKVLLVFVVILSGCALYFEAFGCFTLAFSVAGLLLWYKGYYIQFGNKDRQKLYVKQRFDIYNSMTDDELVNECLLFRIDKYFGTPLLQLGKWFLKILPLILAVCVGVSYNVIVNPDLEILSNIWELYTGHLGVISALINGMIFFIVCCLLNYIELKTRREILEHLIKARGL